MKISVLTLALTAGLAASPVLAQGAMPGMDMPGTMNAQSAPPAPASPPMGGMSGMQGRGMMGQGGMAGCPMMRGSAAAMGTGGAMGCSMMQSGGTGNAGAMGGMQMGRPRGDQSVGSLAMGAINERMHRDMAMEYTGNVDADFARSMIVHHQGAIDMAKVVAAFGKDPKIRELANAIIKAQEDEIATMRTWLDQNAKP